MRKPERKPRRLTWVMILPDTPGRIARLLYVQNLRRSVDFYERLGFRIKRREAHFAELVWEDSRLFIEEIPKQPVPPKVPTANVRIMVPDVDRHWALTREMKLPVIQPLEDRYCGLRDFTVLYLRVRLHSRCP